MGTYNPNSIWDSKEKKFEYTGKGPQPGSLTGPEAQAAAAAKQENERLAENAAESLSARSSMPPKRGGIFRGHGLLWFGIGLVAILAAIFAIIIIKNKPVPQLAISFQEPNQIFVGDPFVVTVSFTNDSGQALNNAQLSVLLPDGVSFIDEAPSQRVLEQSVGAIPSGGTSSKSVNLIVTGNPNSVQHISATMTYGSETNATAQFQSSNQANLVVGNNALQFNFGNTPQSVFSGQSFPITVNYNNESPDPISDAKLMLALPPAFSVVSSSIPYALSGGNGTWDLGAVSTSASSSFTIVGTLTGPADAPYALQGTMIGAFSGQTYPIAHQTANMTIAEAPLALAISLNNASSYVAKTGDELSYKLTYTNNSAVAFASTNITTKLTGAMFDFSKLQTDGSFNSITNVITWNAATDPSLATLAPGESGFVTFNLTTKTAYPIRLVSDKNFLLRALATITSPTVPPNTAGGTGTQSIVELDSKMSGAATIVAKGYFHDPSKIANGGPYPPKANQATKYTVHWQLTNYATDLANVTVSAYLQSGSTFTGVATSSIPSSTPTYDPGTGLVTWTIPSIAATTGVLGKPLEAIFQISNTPAVNQVNQLVTLLGPTTLTASDTFTGQALTTTDQPVTTELPDDTSLNGIGNKQVTQ